MRLIAHLAALCACAALLCAPATAQKISALPNATALGGTEKVAGIQGSGCATQTAPCVTVAVSAAQLATLANATAQPLDSDLTAIAALTTTTFGRSLLTQADAAATRTTIGVTATGTDATYAYRANNLSDLANAGTARTNLGLGTMATQGAGAVAITGGSVTGITDLAIADGGTGSSTASAARTALGLAIGTDVQGFNANLAAISGQTTASNKLIYWTGSGAASLTDLSAFGRSLIDDADAAAARATIGLRTIQSAVAASVTGTLTETVLATISIPANAIGPNGSIEVVSLFNCTSNANTKTGIIRLGGTALGAAAMTTVNSAAQNYTRIANRNAANSQVGFSSLAGLGIGTPASVLTAAIDTTATVTLTITGTLTNTGDTMTLESYLVRINYGA